ncbi:unnamed protein product [Medioppia subpectinata]|uniref:Protein kinase domain-containing protein n=1 Tax=Medioppia subpectinata TaxID=1979941 RepID=A0A7R9KRN4_9ACAR|nr:unnamed protein product [Medioppia subpectinata]CAG2108586.1 unnamed protein product [Medioppia subpectinata]
MSDRQQELTHRGGMGRPLTPGTRAPLRRGLSQEVNLMDLSMDELSQLYPVTPVDNTGVIAFTPLTAPDVDKPMEASTQVNPISSQPEYHITPAPMRPNRDPTSLATGGAPYGSPIPSTSPKYRLKKAFKLLPVGLEPEGKIGSTSAEVYLPSREEMGAPGGSSLGHNEVRDKTLRDLQTLRGKGFDIQLDKNGVLGEGGYGTVYKGVYTEHIGELSGRSGTRIGQVKPGQRFAAKYVQFVSTTVPMFRLYHETERQLLKALKHQNIVTFKMAINLGKKRYLINNIDRNVRPIVSYDRMFLVMECAECSLYKFGTDRRLTDRLAIKFAQDLCSGLIYMHDNGVIHQDIHAGNALVFCVGLKADDFVAKWTDFGTGVSVDLFKRWAVTIGRNEFNHIKVDDINCMVGVIKFMVSSAKDAGHSVPHVLTQLAEDIARSGKSLAECLKDFQKHF